MFKNYFKIAFRNIIRHKACSFLNISGLAIGMACSIFILLWVQNELSYDKSHPDSARLFRLTCYVEDFNAAVTPAGLAEGVQTAMPEVETTVRTSTTFSRLFEAGNLKFDETNVYYADSNFLQVFSFPFLKGNPTTALNRPDAVVITESIAKKYFGNEDAFGKTMRIANEKNLTVTGIISDNTPNSHLRFNVVMPMSALYPESNDLKTKSYENFNFYTYVKFKENVDLSDSKIIALNNRVKGVYKQHNPDGMKPGFDFQRVQDIHLKATVQLDNAERGNIQYVNIFFVVALFILAVACINFMNLATARSARRAKEVGLRKVVGAGRRQLIAQFLGESLGISFISIVLAVLVVWLLLPAFNALSGKTLTLALFDAKLLLSLAGIALMTGLISGSYPALFLSGFKPISVLKGKLRTGMADQVFRNSLVITQFVVSIVLLAGTAVVFKQLNYIRDRNIGFEKTNLLYMPMKGDMWGKQEALTDALKQDKLTSNFSIISDLPVNITSGTVSVYWEGKAEGSQPVIPSISVDENFINVFQAKILNGRSFSEEFKGDSANFVVNETAVKLMGMTVNNAVGKQLDWDGEKGQIIGVVKDFNFKPLQYVIEPLVLRKISGSGTVVIRTLPESTEATIKSLERISSRLNPAYPFNFSFIDQDLANLYRGEQQMGKIFNVFAILAIFISCLGLYGLSAFTAEQRTREIGVRKVLGASVGSIVFLLSGKFTRLILVAMIVAIPVAWYSIDSWLQSFAYRVEISWLVFMGASLASLFIAWLTVSYESVKAAIMNPVKSLRSE
ncbi:ABC transporter permease [Daejeonella lutea]|uniref:Duplicated orphan permease n=1 Tax=Daejeonella lutea TaxID=572036 RepID=A0A1T5A8M7_9SPHI|nr:ABC transporter permease [Daejeonella lutea]SKB31276.1 duplicated orphan permease [Daejeonella lutea]